MWCRSQQDCGRECPEHWNIYMCPKGRGGMEEEEAARRIRRAALGDKKGSLDEKNAENVINM
jgi:hypothetical protein